MILYCTCCRTKLKQTEVDCEYLKRCCETLTEENRRLQKELQELRALKTSQPFYMQLPATTLTMCPSCERVATATTSAATATTAAAATTAAKSNNKDSSVTLQLANKPARLFPFSQLPQAQGAQSTSWNVEKYRNYICKLWKKKKNLKYKDPFLRFVNFFWLEDYLYFLNY